MSCDYCGMESVSGTVYCHCGSAALPAPSQGTVPGQADSHSAQPSTIVADDHSPGADSGVSGWLALFCFVLTVVGPLLTIGGLSEEYQSTSLFFARYPGIIVVFVAEVALSAVVIGFGVYAGLKLTRIRPGAVRTAKRYLLTYLAYSLVIPPLLPLLVGLPPDVDGTLLADPAQSVVRPLFFVLIWYSYLQKSKRVRATFGRESQLASVFGGSPAKRTEGNEPGRTSTGLQAAEMSASAPTFHPTLPFAGRRRRASSLKLVGAAGVLIAVISIGYVLSRPGSRGGTGDAVTTQKGADTSIAARVETALTEGPIAFTSAEGQFSVVLPKYPQHSHDSHVMEAFGIAMTSDSYALETNDYGYNVTVGHYSMADGSPITRFDESGGLDGALTGILAFNNGSHLIRSTKSIVGAHQALDFLIEDSNQNPVMWIRGRLMMVMSPNAPVLYEVMMAGYQTENTTDASDEYERFLDSFKLLES
jgi:hypothetical protein